MAANPPAREGEFYVFSFFGKVIVGGVGVYVVNRVLTKTGILDNAIEVGMPVVAKVVDIVVATAKQAAESAQQAAAAAAAGVPPTQGPVNR
jgi:hypothetical protein